MGGGEGGGPTWLAPVIILAIVVLPFALGLLLRLRDRRRGPVDSAPMAESNRRPLTARFALAMGALLVVAFAFAVAGIGVVALPLVLVWITAVWSRVGYKPRY